MADRYAGDPRSSSDRPFGDRDCGWPSPRDERVTPDHPDDDRRGRSPGAGGAPREWSSTEGWRVPGPHAGRGPKGYQRPDERICDEINERLTAHGLIDASEVDCRVHDGEVVLTGYVDSRAAKRAAEDLAEDVYGVRDVHNQLRVRTHAADTGVGRTSVLGITEAHARPPRRG